MAYFLTGATGFIGRHLVLRLLANREGELYVLVRKGSLGRLEELRERYWPARVAELLLRGGAHETPALGLGAAGAQAGKIAAELAARVHPVTGDLASPLLGLEEQQIEELRGHITDFIHLGGLYDMSASERADRQANVAGTRHALELARALSAERFHHISSIAVAGEYRGSFSERMFDEGQRLPSPYHRTKFEAERLVREQPYVPWRIYRPAIVVGDSQTGEIDKVDGPYYFFKSIKRLRALLPEWLPLAAIDLGRTNIVPVDWVADAIDHLAHESGLDGATFHLADPQGQSIAEVINLAARAAHAPRLALTVDGRLRSALRSAPLSLLTRVPPLAQGKRLLLHELGIPEQVLANMDLVPRLATRETRRALTGAGLERPPALEEYMGRIWAFWERELDRDMRGKRTLREAIVGNHIMITGGSSGIGRAAARKIAEAGGIPILVARNVERLEQVRAEIVAAGGTAYVYAADLSQPEQVDDLLARVFADHQRIDALINNAGRSIRRSVALSYDRFHDYERTMQLNYFAAVKLILGVLPHMRERRRGHIVNISTIGVQANPPRFSAYVASKAALDAFTRVVASEVLGDGVTFTIIHMPLVRTPMIEPTKLYRAFPAITPDDAAEMICEALRSRPKQIGTRLGTTAEVLYALAPRVVDRILHTAYSVFPESAAARGEVVVDEPASLEQIAMATLTRGVHW
jgi:thioester reductase-like protein/short-subunit dehydrogenase